MAASTRRSKVLCSSPCPRAFLSQAISEEVKRALAAIDVRSRTDLVRGLQSCSASLSTAQWPDPFAYLNFRDAVEARQAAVLLGREPLFGKQIRAVVKSDFVGQVSDQPHVNGGLSLKGVDEAVYRQAGELLYRCVTQSPCKLRSLRPLYRL
jgi:hypothetical protein